MKMPYWLLILLVTTLASCDSNQELTTESASPITDEAAKTTPAIETEAINNNVRIGDIELGKVIAKNNCSLCHGMNGVKARSGAPFIAGTEQEYLIRSMIAYTNGARKHNEMQRVTKNIKVDELANVTAYYASLDTEWKGAIANEKSKSILSDKKALKAGARIANSCNGCHGEEGRSNKHVNTPSLAGIPLEYFEPALNSYFNGDREHKLMAMFKDMLYGKDEKIRSIAAYYAIQKPERPSKPQKGNANRGKKLAERCAGCHGYDGNSLNPYMPSLAGTPSEYLIKATMDYRDGKRNDELMQEPAANLSNQQIYDLSAYFALQITESPLHKDIESDGAFHPMEDGKRIAASCNGCHGKNGNSRMKKIPSLAGLDMKYLVNATRSYQLDERHHKAMRNLVSGLSDIDIEKVSYYYASQQPEAQEKESIEGDITRGEKLAPACTMCHGDKGISSDPGNVPNLAGQDPFYLVSATRAYNNGKRHNDSMTSVANDLDKQQLADIASYFAAQQATKPVTYLLDDPATLVEQRCKLCHGTRGYSTQTGVPRLAGQLESYIVLAMQEYQQGLRKDSKMTAMSDVLSLIEIKAIAAYYSKQ